MLSLAACGGSGSSDDNDSEESRFDTGTGFNSRVWSIAPATSGGGDVYVVGTFSEYNGGARNRIAPINSDGSLDAGFDPAQGFNVIVHGITPAAGGSGDIYVGGEFTTYRAARANRIIRLDSTGARN